MPCPDPSLLIALLEGDEAPGPPEGGRLAELHQHLAACDSCRASAEAWRRAVDRWKQVDILEPGRHDDAFFEQLATDIDAEIDRELPRAVPARERRPAGGDRGRGAARTLLFAAAAALLFAGLWSLRPQSPPPVRIEAVDATSQGLSAWSDDELADRARALGRRLALPAQEEEDSLSVLARALDDEPLPADDEDALPWFRPGGLLDELDALSSDELDALAARL